jgi:Histidine kinase
MTVRGFSLRPAASACPGRDASASRPASHGGAGAPPLLVARPWSLGAGYHRARQLALTHALVTDAVLALLLAGVCTPWLISTDPGPAAWLLQAGLLAPLIWRRRYPSGVFAVVSVVALIQWITGIWLVADLAVLVALSTLATYRSRRAPLAAAGVLEVGVVLASVRWSLAGSWLSSLVFLSGMVAAALLLGISVRARSALVATLTERAGRLERERDQQAQIAAAAERARIAREMHDVIGHQLAVMVSLADGAAAKLASDPARAAAAIASVADVGRQALGETRGLLGVLRADGSGDGLARSRAWPAWATWPPRPARPAWRRRSTAPVTWPGWPPTSSWPSTGSPRRPSPTPCGTPAGRRLSPSGSRSGRPASSWRLPTTAARRPARLLAGPPRRHRGRAAGRAWPGCGCAPGPTAGR